MISVEQAQERILSQIKPLPSEEIALASAFSRYTTDDIFAPIDLPAFDNSAMDGYALRAEDVRAASPEHPVPLRVIGKVAAGELFRGTVTSGTCARVFTGSALPDGADAVVMQEDTRSSSHDQVRVLEAVKPWENIRLRGEDVKRGHLIVPAETRLTAARLGLAGAAGVHKVRVSQRPTVAVLATGSELREPGAPLEPGQIYESNRQAIAAMILSVGGAPRIGPLIPDSLEATRQALRDASESADVVVTSGGVSVGEFDFVKQAVEQIGGELDFWKVSMKPGKPFVFGHCGNKLFFGLPGNPVSALVTFALLVRPALLRLQSASQVQLSAQPGTLTEPLVNRGDRRHFVRVTVDSQGHVRSAGRQASHVLSSLSLADGLVDVPPDSTIQAGEIVQVLRWD